MKSHIVLFSFLIIQVNCCPITDSNKKALIDSSKKTNITVKPNPQPSFRTVPNSISINITLKNDPWYIKYLLPSIFTLIIGVISFYLSQVYSKYLERKRAKEKYVGNLKVILEEIKRNLDLECQLHAYLYVGLLPTFGLSFFISDKIFTELSSVCLNYDLLKRIFQKYFEYRHIQNRIDKTIQKAKQIEEVIKNEPKNQDKIDLVDSMYQSERLGTIALIQGNIKGSYALHNSIVSEINDIEKNGHIDSLQNNYLQLKYEEFQNESDINKAVQQNGIDMKKRGKFYE